jgi:hypothetical protein
VIIRHCVEESNIDENMFVIDPAKIRHVVVSSAKIISMSGFIDPATHINLDFPLHKATTCIIAESFQIGAKVRLTDSGFVFARVPSGLYEHLGHVDYTERLFEMVQKVQGIRQAEQKGVSS